MTKVQMKEAKPTGLSHNPGIIMVKARRGSNKMEASRRACGKYIFGVLKALILLSVCFAVCYLFVLFEIISPSRQGRSHRHIALQNFGVQEDIGFRPMKLSGSSARISSAQLSSRSSVERSRMKRNVRFSQNSQSGHYGIESDPSFETTTDQHKDTFKKLNQNGFKRTKEEPVSTFSADVDTSSYSYIRRQLQSSFQLPAPNTVRTEELINYFEYDYPSPQDESSPLEASVMISNSPWSPGRKIMSIGIKGYDPTKVVDAPVPKSNLVFLIDVSGSMASPDCLPLVKESLELLLGALQADDHVSIVTYASGTSVALRPTLVGENKEAILSVIHSLRANGSTNGSGGLEMAYQVAAENFDAEAINRVMLFSDGDFNVGMISGDALTRYISKKRDTGIFLSVFGYGMMGQYRDGTMKALANNGNGVAVYIDSIKEAQKVLVQQAQSTLNTIAKDVKFQVEFNPNRVAEYRLMGYEKRLLAREDFNNDAVDAGEIGAGHTVTVLYEFTPIENDSTASAVDDLRYGVATSRRTEEKDPSNIHEYAFLKMRYKLPKEEVSKLETLPITDMANLNLMEREGGRAATIAQEFRFAIAVAGFAELLKGKVHPRQQTEQHSWSWSDIIMMAEKNLGNDPYQNRQEFVNLARTAKSLVK